MSTERLASLAMYVAPPPVRAATRALWAHLRDVLRAGGLNDVPEALDETISYDEAWLDPRLLLAQTCGYPFATRLRGRVRLVATPCYDHPGCEGPFGRSVLIVREDDPARSIADLAGRRAAINDRASNSGHNLLRVSIAPFAQGRPFFSDVVETGGHAASMAAVTEGTADIAAIDCVTWGNFARHAPRQLAELRVLAETPQTPGLPLITRGSASAAELALLRAALDHALADSALAGARRTLGLIGFEHLTDADYDPILHLERDAITLGYPAVA